MSYRIFEKGSNLLPAFSKPYPDESISSWLTRLSFDHGLRRSALLRLIGANPKRDLSSWGIDTLFNDAQIRTLTEYTNCSADEILQTTLRTYEGKLFDTTPIGSIPSMWLATKAGEKRLKQAGKGIGTLFCPSCFAKKDQPVYYRKHWRLAVSFVCIECKCYLRESCPHCKNGPSDMNNITDLPFGKTIAEYFLECGNCQCNISDCNPIPAPEHVIAMQHQILELINGKGTATYGGSVNYFKTLYKLTGILLGKRYWSCLSRMVDHLYKIHPHVVDLKPEIYSLNVRTLPLKLQADIFSIACWLMDEWPTRLIDMCTAFQVSSADLLPRLTDLPEWVNKMITDRLGEFSETKWRARIRRERPPLEDHDVIQIQSNRESDYDIDIDEHYYLNQEVECAFKHLDRPLDNTICTADIIFHQLRKAEGWA